jgi:CheY-like chemotaxis protein
MKVLIADDNNVNLKILNKCLEDLDCEIIEARNGFQAVAEFEKNEGNIELCLLDIMMPGMSGVAAAKKIKEINPETMIVFVSALSSEEDLLSGLNIAFDYVTKPIIIPVFKSKMINLMENIKLKEELKKKKKEADELNRIIQEEQEMGLSIMNNFQKRFTLKNKDQIDSHTVPFGLFSGDNVLIAQSTNNKSKYVMLADAVGHGLPAAINLLPIYHPYETMCKKDLSLADIIKELDLLMSRVMPIDRFLSAIILKINSETSIVEVWNGGMPGLIKVNENLGKLEEFKSKSFPLGLNSMYAVDEEFNPEIKEIKLNHDDKIVMFSDGVLESQQVNFNLRTLLSFIDFNLSAEEILQKIKGEWAYHDDASLVLIKNI